MARPDLHARQRELGRTGMRRDLEQLPDDHVGPLRADPLDPLDLHAEQGQALGQGLGLEVEVDHLPQPGKRHAHG